MGREGELRQAKTYDERLEIICKFGYQGTRCRTTPGIRAGWCRSTTSSASTTPASCSCAIGPARKTPEIPD